MSLPGKGRAVVYVYREQEVQQCLADPQAIVFLHTYGYESTDVDACLNHLSQRVSLSAQGAESYPHEMGIFLGYPLEDVRGFILHEGKDSRYTGYWKVYGDVEQAKQTFQAYDNAKECAVVEFMAGKQMKEMPVKKHIKIWKNVVMTTGEKVKTFNTVYKPTDTGYQQPGLCAA